MLRFVVTVTFLLHGYDIYHTSIPNASTGYRDYPTEVTVSNYTHDFQSAILCEASDETDLNPKETLDEVFRCFSNSAQIRDLGITPVCTVHELADMDWYYWLWYDFIVAGMVLYGFFLCLIAAHDISVLCKNSAIVGCCRCKKVEDHDHLCHCKKFRQWIQLCLFVVTNLFVFVLGLGCFVFTELSAVSSTFISEFDLGFAGGILPCNCGCVLHTPTSQGWAFWFAMHLFMWYTLLALNKIKLSYKMGPRMFTMVAPVPIEMGEYGIDDAIFWERVWIKHKHEKAIEVDMGNQDDSIDCMCIPIIGRFLTFSDWNLTVVSYRMFYTHLVVVVGIVILDGLSFWFQILLRSYEESILYVYGRVGTQIVFGFLVGVITCFTFATLQMIPSANTTSTLASGFLLNLSFHLSAYVTHITIIGYTNHDHWLVYLWITCWLCEGLVLLLLWMLCLCWWKLFDRKVHQDLKTYALKLLERDSMGQNLQFFYLCGAPMWGYPEWFKKIIDFAPADRIFEMQIGGENMVAVQGDVGGVELITQHSNREASHEMGV